MRACLCTASDYYYYSNYIMTNNESKDSSYFYVHWAEL